MISLIEGENSPTKGTRVSVRVKLENQWYIIPTTVVDKGPDRTFVIIEHGIASHLSLDERKTVLELVYRNYAQYRSSF